MDLGVKGRLDLGLRAVKTQLRTIGGQRIDAETCAFEPARDRSDRRGARAEARAVLRRRQKLVVLGGFRILLRGNQRFDGALLRCGLGEHNLEAVDREGVRRAAEVELRPSACVHVTRQTREAGRIRGGSRRGARGVGCGGGAREHGGADAGEYERPGGGAPRARGDSQKAVEVAHSSPPKCWFELRPAPRAVTTLPTSGAGGRSCNITATAAATAQVTQRLQPGTPRQRYGRKRLI